MKCSIWITIFVLVYKLVKKTDEYVSSTNLIEYVSGQCHVNCVLM